MLPRTRIELPADLKDLAYRTLGAAYRVHTRLGPGLRESHYRRCLMHALRQDGIGAVENAPIDLEFEGLELPRALLIDILVEDTIVLELKARSQRDPVWDSQILSYIEHARKPLGYVVNFHSVHLRKGIRPMINRPLFEKGDDA